MQKKQWANTQIWYDEKLLTDEVSASFDPKYWQDQKAVIGQAYGRGITWFVQTKHLPCALRHYYRGGLLGRIIRDLYPFTGWKQTRAYREFILLAELRSLGVPVPRPVAARVVKYGLFYRADLLSELIPHTQDLVTILMQKTISDSLCQKIGKLVRQLHDAGVCHSDLNIHNILVDKEERLWLIDFDKCGHRSGKAWKAENLSRLKRSFAKEIRKHQIHWTRAQWDLLLQAYL